MSCLLTIPTFCEGARFFLTCGGAVGGYATQQIMKQTHLGLFLMCTHIQRYIHSYSISLIVEAIVQVI